MWSYLVLHICVELKFCTKRVNYCYKFGEGGGDDDGISRWWLLLDGGDDDYCGGGEKRWDQWRMLRWEWWGKGIDSWKELRSFGLIEKLFEEGERYERHVCVFTWDISIFSGKVIESINNYYTNFSLFIFNILYYIISTQKINLNCALLFWLILVYLWNMLC